MVRCILAIVTAALLASSATAQFAAARPSWRPGQALENFLLFHPRTDKQWWAPLPPYVQVEDVWLNSGDGERIHAWWFPESNSSGAVLFCHGNAGNLNQWSPRTVMVQRALGKSVLIFDYPGFGKSTGKPSERGCLAAGEAAFHHVTNVRKIPAQDVVLFGESLGGGVATALAEKHAYHSLLLVRTFASIPAVARGHVVTYSAAALVQNTFDNQQRLPRCRGPVFIAHGDRDRLIPISQAHQLYQVAPEPKRFYLMKGLGHNETYTPELLTEMADFVRHPERPVQAPDIRLTGGNSK